MNMNGLRLRPIAKPTPPQRPRPSSAPPNLPGYKDEVEAIIANQIIRGRVQSTVEAGSVQPPEAGATVDVATVASIAPAGPHTCANDLGAGLCIHEDPSAPVGLRRGAALRSLDENDNLPALRTVCTGLVQQVTKPLPKAQRQYALEMGRTGFCLCAHPLYNQWSLLNEPVAGAKANCVVKMQDVHIAVPLSYLNNYNSQLGNSARGRRRERAAKAAANQKLMTREASLTVALVVQVETTGNDGVLTLHYGDGFDRTWEVGEPAKDSSLDMDVVGFVRRVLPSSEREANDEEVFRALLRCGAPRDDFTARLAEQERRRAVGPRQPLVKRLHGPSMEGPATIPVRSELKGAKVEALAPAEPQDGICVRRAIDLDEPGHDGTTGRASAAPVSTTNQPADHGAGNENDDNRARPIVVSALRPAPSPHGWDNFCHFRGKINPDPEANPPTHSPQRPAHLSGPQRPLSAPPTHGQSTLPSDVWRPSHPPPSSPPPPSGGGGGPIPAASVFERYAGVSTTS